MEAGRSQSPPSGATFRPQMNLEKILNIKYLSQSPQSGATFRTDALEDIPPEEIR